MQDIALIVIDLQETVRADRDAGSAWAIPNAPETAGRRLAAFRAAGPPVVHVHHNAADPKHGFYPDNPLSVATPEVAPLEIEPVIVKIGSSGFIGTALEATLREAGVTTLVIVGGEANMWGESTMRMAGNPGFKTTVVADTLVNFQRTLRGGRVVPRQTVLDMTLANLTSFAHCAQVLAELSSHP